MFDGTQDIIGENIITENKNYITNNRRKYSFLPISFDYNGIFIINLIYKFQNYKNVFEDVDNNIKTELLKDIKFTNKKGLDKNEITFNINFKDNIINEPNCTVDNLLYIFIRFIYEYTDRHFPGFWTETEISFYNKIISGYGHINKITFINILKQYI